MKNVLTIPGIPNQTDVVRAVNTVKTVYAPLMDCVSNVWMVNMVTTVF